MDGTRNTGRLAFALGLGSPLLLVAALVWAHHWNPLTLSLVVAWVVAMVATPIVAIRALRQGSTPRHAELGLALNVLTWLTVLLWGLAVLEFGASVPSCGGG